MKQNEITMTIRALADKNVDYDTSLYIDLGCFLSPEDKMLVYHINEKIEKSKLPKHRIREVVSFLYAKHVGFHNEE